MNEQAVIEAFRKQAIASGAADECVIDKDTYAEISDVYGCFKRNNAWIVYETDDRAQVCNARSHFSAISAYSDLANRLDFQFHAPETRISQPAHHPGFVVGDTIRVFIKATESGRGVLRVFEGTVVAKRCGSSRETFTVRRDSYGIGVERTFPMHSPRVDHIEVVRHGKVRLAKQHYLRNQDVKAAKR